MSTTEVETQLEYLRWIPLYEKEKPFKLFLNIPADAKDKRESNLVFDKGKQIIRDIRGDESRFNLDDHGFCFRNHKSAVDDLRNHDIIENEYLFECEQLLKDEVDNVDRVVIFDWRVRLSLVYILYSRGRTRSYTQSIAATQYWNH